MFREVFDNVNVESYFITHCTSVMAPRIRGVSGMHSKSAVANGNAAGSSARSNNDICLRCGKRGHRADSGVHANEYAEGSDAEDGLKQALHCIAVDSKLSADCKKHWSGRIRGYWAALTGSRDAGAS